MEEMMPAADEYEAQTFNVDEGGWQVLEMLTRAADNDL